MNDKELFKELKSFCKDHGIDERQSGFLLGMFNKYVKDLKYEADRYEHISKTMAYFYSEDNDTDLCDIGEWIAAYTGWL